MTLCENDYKILFDISSSIFFKTILKLFCIILLFIQYSNNKLVLNLKKFRRRRWQTKSIDRDEKKMSNIKYVFVGGILLWLHAAYSAAQRKFN